jgi:hypothetical protein
MKKVKSKIVKFGKNSLIFLGETQLAFKDLRSVRFWGGGGGGGGGGEGGYFPFSTF